jgi:hypothetical protein
MLANTRNEAQVFTTDSDPKYVTSYATVGSHAVVISVLLVHST